MQFLNVKHFKHLITHLGVHDASKPKSTKTMQWNAFGDKKETDDQCDSRDYTQRKIQR